MVSGLSFSKFPFLRELGLSEHNLGCYKRGEWVANGEETVSLNPVNGEKVAVTKTASVQDYNDCVAAMAEEKARWQTTQQQL